MPGPSTPQINVTALDDDGLEAAARLSQEVFGFADRDVVPAWEMRFATRHGALALGAFAADELVGCSYAFPAFRGARPYLYSNGLAVRRDWASRGVGRRLKLAQRAHALARGHERIVWTVNPLASRMLHLSLNRLGAVLTDFEASAVERFIPGVALDEAQIEWALADDPALRPRAPLAAAIPPTVLSPGAEPTGTVAHVEIPWDWTALRADPGALAARRHEVGASIRTLLARGYVGVALAVVATRRRSFVRFEHRAGRA